MAVPHRLREIENEIDATIEQMPVWRASKTDVLKGLMRVYRDGVELALIMAARFATSGGSLNDLGNALGHEDRIRAGALWALKWASEYCDVGETRAAPSDDELLEVILLGQIYETFVDALKYANLGLVTVQVDEANRTISFYEGGPVTRFDADIVHHQRIAAPMTPHVSLTEDGDHLTSRWTAGDYRCLASKLSDFAAHEENTFLLKAGESEMRIPRPTLVTLVRPDSVPDCLVFHDLLIPTVIGTDLKWKLVSLLDTPIVRVGDRFCALSSDLKAIARMDDYMLRLAARVVQLKYSTATTLREERMIGMCRDAFKHSSCSWSFDAHVHLKDPPQEVDVLAKGRTGSVVLQLKSTLRPETPWEVYKRNEDILDGVKHTKSLIDRGVASQGFVMTDGYRGDCDCWAQALESGIPIATLYDLEVITADPALAVSEVKKRAGITVTVPDVSASILDRAWRLSNWCMRLVDAQPPTDE